MRINIMLTILASAFLLAAVSADTIQEAARIQLASEHNVGYGLASQCTTFNYEADSLCTGRKPFKLFGDAQAGCKNYFWCSPDHGACLMACPAGTVFNGACNCCQDSASATTAAFNWQACSSETTAADSLQTQQQAAAVPATAAADQPAATAQLGTAAAPEDAAIDANSAPGNARRALLTSDPDTRTNTPSSRSSRARARARQAARRKRREAAATAATAVTGGSSDSVSSLDDLSTVLPQPVKRRMARRASQGSVWNSHGKKYTGRWAGSNVVKEPAVRVPTPGATEPAPLPAPAPAPTPTPAQAVEAAVAAAMPSAADEPDESERKLLEQPPAVPAPAISSQARAAPTGMQRSMKMKRMKNIAARAAAAAAAAGDPAAAAATADALEHVTHWGASGGTGSMHRNYMRQKIRPLAKKPAAKALDPEDESSAPFAQALAAAAAAAAGATPKQPAAAATAVQGTGDVGVSASGGGAGGQMMHMRRKRMARRTGVPGAAAGVAALAAAAGVTAAPTSAVGVAQVAAVPAAATTEAQDVAAGAVPAVTGTAAAASTSKNT